MNHFIKGLNAGREVERREARSADIAVRLIKGLTEGKITVHYGLEVKKERLRRARANVPIHRIKLTFKSFTHFLHIRLSHKSLPNYLASTLV